MMIIILIITLVLMDEGHIQKAKPLKVSRAKKKIIWLLHLRIKSLHVIQV